MKSITSIVIFVLCLTLGACANGKRSLKKIQVTKGTTKDVVVAAKKPIYDTNLTKKKIPRSLKNIDKVYQAPTSCAAYQQELAILNEALGEDLIDMTIEGSDTLSINLSQAISSSLTPGIPLRSLVRQLSGAKKHEIKRLDAIFRGKSRRSYIKGWAAGHNCSSNNEPG